MRTIRIGGGAGYSGDRIEPAVELARYGQLDYLVFECLAERTIALAQRARLTDPSAGYDPLLVERMEAVLPICHDQGVRIITNMGGANPVAASARVIEVARRHQLNGLTVATVTGDNVLELVRGRDLRLQETGRRVSELGDTLVSANAYLGAEPLVEALSTGASVILTGRVADPSLGLSAQMHAFGWAPDDWEQLGRGTVVGHLIECAGQITGGYFADPGYKDVPDLARLGFPIAEVTDDGVAIITKVSGSGGRVTVQTCTEQLFYEVHQPDRYTTPDTVADFSAVQIADAGPDRVRISGGTGRPRPDTLKVSVGYRDGFVGEGQISYAGPGAVTRARLAGQIVTERLKLTGVETRETRLDLIGVDSVHGARLSGDHPDPYEVRLRVVARTATERDANRVAREVETLLTNGPAGGGGATRQVTETVAIESTFLPRSEVATTVTAEGL
ncbi:MAG: acyclic terpene utilization AtuA family protein [Vicinamibacterales bacterium]